MSNFLSAYSSLRRSIAQHIINIKGWSTKRKIVVIESDDWGSIRMPSTHVYNSMIKKGISVQHSPYCKYDSLASEDDLSALFDTLRGFRDIFDNHPVITANCIVSNPDFEKISKNNFHKYYGESITETFKKYPAHSRCYDLWLEGNKNGIFHPQSHGKEHLNTYYWLQLLKKNIRDFNIAFDNNFWGLSSDIYPGVRRSVQAAFDMENPDEIFSHKKTIQEGLDHFEDLFGYRSESFIANNYIWSSKLNKTLLDCGVNYIQGMKYQKMPIYNSEKRKMVRHYMGEKNDLGQYYLVRNCFFEPSLRSDNYDHIGECLNGISTAFFWNRPAIICSHRINYIGFLDVKNRTKNLKLLKSLLESILKRWPNVEFMTSDHLGRCIKENTEGINLEEHSKKNAKLSIA